METPHDIEAVLKRLLERRRRRRPDDARARRRSVFKFAFECRASGRRAVLIVEDADERLRYMFSNATRAEAVTMLGKVVEATGRRIADGDD